MYVAVAVRLFRACVPLVACAPLQPLVAVQEVALVEDQVRVAEPPEATDVGLAERETVGAGEDEPDPGSENCCWFSGIRPVPAGPNTIPAPA